MQSVLIQRSFESWRAAARVLVAGQIRPEDVLWHEEGAEQPMLEGLAVGSEATACPPSSPHAARIPRVPAAFLEVAEDVACHRDPERWALLYRVLWRITHGERQLMHVEVDDDIRRLKVMQSQVTTDIHKMMGFVRFQQVASPDSPNSLHYIAYYRPAHYALRRASRWFIQRMYGLTWSILTRDESADYDGQTLRFGPGVPANPTQGDELESLWRTYYASVFNPARLSLDTMKRCMPTKYWSSMPETQLVPELAAQAVQRVGKMVQPSPQDTPSGGT